MDASLAAFVLGTVNLALLGLQALAWRRDRGEPSWRLKMALRLQELDQRLNELSGQLKTQWSSPADRRRRRDHERNAEPERMEDRPAELEDSAWDAEEDPYAPVARPAEGKVGG